MKRFLSALALVFLTITAFASPNPKQVEQALANGDYSGARSMVVQVLAEHPNSARAHLLNAYLMAHDGNPGAANAELSLVRQLDTKGDVIRSPLYGKVASQLTSARTETPATSKYAPPSLPNTVARQSTPAPTPVATHDSGGGFGGFLVFILILAAVIGGVIYWFSKRQSVKPTIEAKKDANGLPSVDDIQMPPPFEELGNDPTVTPPAPATTRPTYTPRVQRAAPQPTAAPFVQPVTPVYQQTYQAPPAPAMSTGGAMAVGAAAGVAGTVVVDTMIENAVLRERTRNLERERRDRDYYSSTPAPAPYYAPTPAPAARDEDSFSSSTSRDTSWRDNDDDNKKSSFSSSSNDRDDSWGSGSSSSSSSSDTGSSDSGGGGGSWD